MSFHGFELNPHIVRILAAAVFGLAVFAGYRRLHSRMQVRHRVSYIAMALKQIESLTASKFIFLLPRIPLFDAGPQLLDRAERIGLKVDERSWPRYRLAVALGGSLLGFFLTRNIGGALMGTGLGMYLPILYVNSRFMNHQDRIINDFPLFANYLRVYLLTGLNIPQALQRVTARLSGPLQAEIARMNAKIEITGDYEAPFREFGARCGFPQAQQLAESLVHGWRTGLRPESFAQQAQLVRDIRQMSIKREIKKAPVRIVAIPGVVATVNMLLLIGYPITVMLLESLSNLSF